jgi:hypothetical protein
MASDFICGGIYEYSEPSGKRQQGTLTSVTIQQDGSREGTFWFHGYAPERVLMDSERYQQFSLVGRPASPKVGRPRKE